MARARYKVTSFVTVQSRQIIDANKRVTQRAVQSGALQTQNIGNIIQRGGGGTGTVTIAPGDGSTMVAESFSLDDKRLMIVHESAIWQDSNNNYDNAIPGGANVTMSDYQTMGPFTSAIDVNGAVDSDGNNQYITLYIANLTASPVDIIWEITPRYIMNQGGVAS